MGSAPGPQVPRCERERAQGAGRLCGWWGVPAVPRTRRGRPRVTWPGRWRGHRAARRPTCNRWCALNQQPLVTPASGSCPGRAGRPSNGAPTLPSVPAPLPLPVPSAPPRKVEAEALNATAIRVLWRSPLPGRQHGQIRGYQVHYVRMEGAEARGPPRIKDIMLADAQVGGARAGRVAPGGGGARAPALSCCSRHPLISSSLPCRLLPCAVGDG